MDSLADLKRRGIVRAAFIDELTSVLVVNHPSYYGVMVWVLMMLEQWLKVQVDTVIRPSGRNSSRAGAVSP
jgi:asparagine synthase (glutamine-hydrolysing)